MNPPFFMKTQRLTFKIVYGHAPVCRTMYSTPDFNSLIQSFVSSYRPHALTFNHTTKMAPIQGKKNI
jgi:hypothetical protein